MNATKLALAHAIMDRIVNGTKLNELNHDDDSFDVIASRTTDVNYAGHHCKELHKMASNWLTLPDDADFDEPFDGKNPTESTACAGFVLMNWAGKYAVRTETHGHTGTKISFCWTSDLNKAHFFNDAALRPKDRDILRGLVDLNKVKMMPVNLETSRTISIKMDEF